MRPVGIAAIALTLVLGACAVATDQPGDKSGMPQEVPADAIQVGDDYYMVPSGTASDGCPKFRPWSESGRVPAAIYYRKADGDFTRSRDQADCAAG